MPDDILRPKESVHPAYYSSSGEKLPSVTTILGIVSKPFLTKWANSMGLKGINTEDYTRNITGIGTLAHAKVQGFLEGKEVDESGYTAEQRGTANQCFIKFMEWRRAHAVELIFSEKSLVSERNGYGGTIDAFLLVDGTPTIVDFKTSGSVSIEYFAQLAAYYQMMGENGFNAERLAILWLPKDERGFEYITKEISETGPYWEFFRAALALYVARREMGANP